MKKNSFPFELLLHPHDHKRKSDWWLIFNFLDKYIDYSRKEKILDRGSGLGDLALYFIKKNKNCQAICEDNKEEYLSIAEKRSKNIKGFLHDINQPLPFEDNSFNFVSCIGTLHYHYAENPEEILREMARVSKKYILIDVFFKKSPWTLIHKLLVPAYNPKRYNIADVERMFVKCNLEVVATEGTRIIFSKWFPFFGRTTIFLLKKELDKSVNKIVFLMPVLRGGGAERNLVNLVNYFDEKYKVEIWGGKIEKEFFWHFPKNIEIFDIKAHSEFLLFIKIIKFLRKEKPQILVSAFPHINTICLIAKFLLKSETKIVLTEHTTFSHIPATARTLFRRVVAKFILPSFMKFFYPKADAIICVSKGVADDIIFLIPKLTKISVIYNPIVDKSIVDLSKMPVLHPWFRNNNPIIISVGRLVKAKDYPCLLEAFKIVLKKMPCKLVILGEGQERKKLEKLSCELGISENIGFLGFQENPFNYMAKSSVFALSSKREGFGNVVIEAMALGIPVVATDSTGPKEIIENNKNGILVPVGNKKMLAEAIIKVLEDLEFSRKLSERGLKRAQDFTIEKSIKEYENIFSKILNL